jgi:hypothetical protein
MVFLRLKIGMIMGQKLPRDGITMSHEHEKTRRCGWIALVIIIFLVQGILPGSLLGGVTGLKVANAMFGQHMGSDLLSRLFCLGGMITGLMVSAVIIMTLTLALSGISTGFLKRAALIASKEKPVSDEFWSER